MTLWPVNKESSLANPSDGFFPGYFTGKNYCMCHPLFPPPCPQEGSSFSILLLSLGNMLFWRAAEWCSLAAQSCIVAKYSHTWEGFIFLNIISSKTCIGFLKVPHHCTTNWAVLNNRNLLSLIPGGAESWDQVVSRAKLTLSTLGNGWLQLPLVPWLVAMSL